MRSVLFISFFFVVILAIDLYTYRGLRVSLSTSEFKHKNIIFLIHWIIPVLFLFATFFIKQMRAGLLTNDYTFMFLYLGAFVLLYVPKLVFVSFQLFNDLVRLAGFITQKMSTDGSSISEVANKMTRTAFLSQIGLGLAAIPFLSIIWGMAKGRFNFKVREETLSFSHLPEEFDGFRVLQISDMHIGSFMDNKDKVEAAVEMINSQHADIVCFTGDMVNDKATELEGWEDILSKIKAKAGKYAVLGNHDYGHYVDWGSEEEKIANLNDLLERQKRMGFRTLNNESMILQRGESKIALVGVENWGTPPFPQYGDYDKAVSKVEEIPFKMLLSHDPSHWDEKILQKTDVALTLSGHTHGMQMGIEIPGFRWSPVKYRYKRWGGMYNEDNQYLYVNIGFGFIAFPGRVGTPPEITVIELKKTQNS